MRLPVFTSLVPYRPEWLRGDIVAGLTVWAVLVPEALAYASIAGVSPVVGLYAAPAALIFYAALGSSRHLVVGPMSATAALSAASVAEFADLGSDRFTQLTIALAITTGLAALIAGLLRLGFLANYISEPVLKGFIVGLALTIIAGQLPKLFGVHGRRRLLREDLGPARQPGRHERHDAAGRPRLARARARAAAGRPGRARVAGRRRFGVAVVKLLRPGGVEIVGHIDSGLPSLGLPDVRSDDYFGLAAAAVGVMLVGFSEGLGAAKTYAQREHYEIDTNRELLGLGAANLGAGLSSGMVVNGSLSKTAVNGSAGARSQLSGLTVAALTVVTLLFLTGLFEDLPEATLAAVVIAAVIELVDVPALVRLYRIFSGAGRPAPRPARCGRTSCGAVAALLGVLVFDTLPGLFIGIAVSLLLLLYRSSTPHVAVLGKVPGQRPPVRRRRAQPGQRAGAGGAHRAPESRALLRQRRAHPARDPAAGRVERGDGRRARRRDRAVRRRRRRSTMLSDLALELHGRGVRLVFARDVGDVRDVVARAAEGDLIAQIFPTVHAAVEALQRDAARPSD